MKPKRNTITKLFDGEIKFDKEWITLNINNQETNIHINGYFNKKTFEDILEILGRLTKSEERPTISFYHLRTEETDEEEWPITQLIFTNPGLKYREDTLILVDIHHHTDASANQKNPDFCYIINKENLCHNILDLVEKNIDTYNKEAKKRVFEDGKFMFYYPLDEKKYLKIKREILKKLDER